MQWTLAGSERHMYPHTEVSSEPRVSGCRWTLGSQTTVIKQGNNAKDLENVWGALQDLGPRLQKLHPNGYWWWNFHCTNGMWHFSELMMIEQVESERRAFSCWGRLAVWSSDGEMNLLFDHKQYKEVVFGFSAGGQMRTRCRQIFKQMTLLTDFSPLTKGQVYSQWALLLNMFTSRWKWIFSANQQNLPIWV